MGKNIDKDTPPKFGYKNLFAVFLIVLTLFFLWRYISTPGLSVEEVVSNSDQYIGTVVTVRGIATGTLIESTLSECEPFSCDCNETFASYFVLGSKQDLQSSTGMNYQKIIVNALNCHGDECSMHCDQFVHKIGDEYSFTGVLNDNHFGDLSLENVNLNRAMNKVGWVWLPVQTLGGKFNIR